MHVFHSAKPLRCRLTFHQYQRRYSDDATGASHYYLECSGCGASRDIRATVGG